MPSLLLLFLFLILPTSAALAAEEESGEIPAYWDYGIGFGAVHYEHYPAADQFADIAVPAPTFQYRGKILRADERDGAHLYIFKGKTTSLELSGVGFPSLNSSNNSARSGMANLPWMLAIGPQLISRAVPNFEFGLGVYQAVSTDFDMTRFAGNIFEARAMYMWSQPFKAWGLFKEDGIASGKLTLSFKGASQELQALYYEVPIDKVRGDRPAYDAVAGFLSRDLTYYQSFKSGRASFNIGVSWASYDQAANHNSPLHKSNNNITALMGFNYVLGESTKPEVPESDTSGVINTLRKNRQLRPEN